jgi:hypothetical protein
MWMQPVIAPRPNRPPISYVTKDFQRLSPDTRSAEG